MILKLCSTFIKICLYDKFLTLYICNENFEFVLILVQLIICAFIKGTFMQVENREKHHMFSSFQFSKESGFMHSGHKFKCDFCVYSTNIATNFRNHQRTHSGDKPYKCSFCQRAFTTKQNLKKHLLVHESVTNKDIMSLELL